VDIVCVGGGPAGLYFAVSLKLREPRHRVRVFDRSPEGSVYGWGFGFWDAVLDELHANDPVIGRQVEEACGVWDGIEVHIGDRSPAYLGGYGLSMSRTRLMEILVARARELGVELEFERPVDDLAEFADADLIVAADGIRSEIREVDRDTFGTSIDRGNNYYLWLGTDKLFNAFQYVFEKTSAGWIWMHSYYLDGKRSTCVVECPPETWHGLGLDQLNAEECLKQLETIFVEKLDGHRLISQVEGVEVLLPGQGKQVRNQRWYHGNIALVGDAAHTTHFSIGSGTRLAIGDGEALAAAVHAHGDDVAAALRSYDATRRPEIDHLQQQALRSMIFLESMPARLDAPDMDPTGIAYALSKRLGTRTERWRYFMHLATQLRAGRWARGRLSSARRSLRVRRRAQLASPATAD
jgi:anthraniloyl-CoA monooxygenase